MASKLGNILAASTEVYSAKEVDDLLVGKIPYFEGTRQDGETDSEVLTRITTGKTVKVGSLAVIETVDGDNTTYTAYMYVSVNGEAPSWKAMNGNYSADNVIFDSDLIFTANIGVKTIGSGGSGTISAKGKTVTQVLKSILAQQKYPVTPTSPSASITLTNAGASECGTTVTPAWKTTFNKGSYQYGPDTGIVPNAAVAYHGTDADADKVDIEAGTLNNKTGTFAAVKLTAGQTIKAKLKWSSPASEATPVTNTGNDATVDQEDCEGVKVSKIAAVAENEVQSSNSITGYRMGRFYGTTPTAMADGAITSAIIRGLTKNNSSTTTGTFSFTVKSGARSIVIAIAGNRTLSKVLNTTVNADMTESFTKCTDLVSVAGADAPSMDNAGDYSVWFYTPAEAYASDANLTVTIA